MNPALGRLHDAGHRLGIVSNVDDDLLTGSLRHLDAPFDVRVTAERVRSYKPRPDHFRVALEEVGGRTDALLHVAQSWYHDVQAAVPMGIPVVWVNRQGEELPAECPEPTAEVATVAGAVDWLGAR